MMMLYIILTSGVMQMQTLDIQASDAACLQVAQELRKSDKVAEAFCLISDPENQDKAKIGRYPKDGESSN